MLRLAVRIIIPVNHLWYNAKLGYSLIIKQTRDIMRQVVIYPGEDNYWIAECPSLPGCISQGETREQAIENIKEAIAGYVKALEEDGLPVPPERFETLLVAV